MTRTERDVEQLVSDNERLVDFMVNRYLKRYHVGDMEREDLVSWGLMGLLQAARAWDPSRGRSFSTLACKAIERMIIRGVNREWKPDHSAATLSLDALIGGGGGDGRDERFVDLLADEEDLEERLLAHEAQSAVRAAVASLPQEQRALIQRHFYDGVPVRDIARELGLTRQGVYMRQRGIFRQLRETLSPAMGG